MSVIRIGVVEDDPDNRRGLLDSPGAILRRARRRVLDHGIRRRSELIERYRPEFDILLLDVQMPHMDGLEAAHRIREIDADVIIIFVTNMAQYAIKGYEVDALSYLVKPVPYYAFAQEMGRSLARLRRQSRR